MEENGVNRLKLVFVRTGAEDDMYKIFPPAQFSEIDISNDEAVLTTPELTPEELSDMKKVLLSTFASMSEPSVVSSGTEPDNPGTEVMTIVFYPGPRLY